jgi:hypothetical protein
VKIKSSFPAAASFGPKIHRADFIH